MLTWLNKRQASTYQCGRAREVRQSVTSGKELVCVRIDAAGSRQEVCGGNGHYRSDWLTTTLGRLLTDKFASRLSTRFAFFRLVQAT